MSKKTPREVLMALVFTYILRFLSLRAGWKPAPSRSQLRLECLPIGGTVAACSGVPGPESLGAWGIYEGSCKTHGGVGFVLRFRSL